MKWEARIGQSKCQHLAYSVLSNGQFRSRRLVKFAYASKHVAFVIPI